MKTFMIVFSVLVFGTVIDASSPFSLAAVANQAPCERPSTPEGHINISAYDKAEVLIALYNQNINRARDARLTHEHATFYLNISPEINWLGSLPLSINLRGNYLNPAYYDKMYGAGSARKAIDGIQIKKDTNDWYKKQMQSVSLPLYPGD